MTDAYHRIMNPLWPFIGKMYRHPIHTGVVVAMSAGVIVAFWVICASAGVGFDGQVNFGQVPVGGSKVELVKKICIKGVLGPYDMDVDAWLLDPATLREDDSPPFSFDGPRSFDLKVYWPGQQECARIKVLFSPTTDGSFERIVKIRTLDSFGSGHTLYYQLLGTGESRLAVMLPAILYLLLTP